jgi:3-deoxy-manno-octulosonate cytidylyltransferase (CMP-KDO synthetase)
MPAAKVAVVIPARYGSTRFPGKPLFRIAGKPLIQHVWERCSKARGISTVIVATDDMRIAEAAFGFGAEVSMTSPKHRSGTDRCAEVARRLRGTSHIINVQGDEPLIDPALVSRLAQALVKDRTIAMITAANVFGSDEDVGNPNAVKVVLDRNSDALYFSRSAIPFVRADGCEAPFYRHQGIYGYSAKLLLEFVKWKPGILERCEQLEQLRALENGARIRVLITKSASIGVDAPEDAALVERLLARKNSRTVRTPLTPQLSPSIHP